MGTVNITYIIRLNNNQTETFDYKLDEHTFDLISSDVENPPHWVKLEHNQCSHCPLKVEDQPHCPLALQLYDVVERFHGTRSIDEVEMEVMTEGRRVIQETTIQQAIASMLDLIIPICGCPKTEHMKPMSRFHLPLASEEETVFRVTGMYLLSQYFLRMSSGKGRIELDGLTLIYEDMHILNCAIAGRLRHATTSDSSKNAITLLDMYTTLVPALIEDELFEMRGFFKAYFPDGQGEVISTSLFDQAKALSLEVVPVEGEVAGGDGDGRPEWLKEVRGSESDSVICQETENTGTFLRADIGSSSESIQEEQEAGREGDKIDDASIPTVVDGGLELTLDLDDSDVEPTLGKSVFKLAPDD